MAHSGADSIHPDWITQLSQVDNDDDQVKRAACEWLEQQRKQDTMVALSILFTIVCSDQPLHARQMASILTQRFLSSKGPADLRTLRTTWTARTDLADQIKTALYRLVVADDPAIQANCTNCFALVLGIELGNWVLALNDVADQLEASMASPSDNPIQLIGLLSIFKALCSLTNFNDLPLPVFWPFLTRLWAASLYFLSAPDIPDPTRLLAAECVHGALSAIPGLISSFDQAMAVLAPLGAPLRGPDAKLCFCCNHIMLELTKQYYAAAPSFIATIWDYTIANIVQAESRQRCKDSMVFWSSLADWELRQFHGQGDGYQRLCEQAAPALLPVLFEVVCAVDPADRAVEDPAVQDTGFSAATAIASFYRLAPQPVFQSFIEATFARSIRDADWRRQHGALLLLFAMSTGEAVDAVCPFIARAIGPLLEHCRTADNPRLQETALYVLAMILQAYRKQFLGLTKSESPTVVLDRVLGVVQVDHGLHPLILRRYCEILRELARLFDGSLASPALWSRFETMVSLVNGLRESADLQVYETASEALDHIVAQSSVRENGPALFSLIDFTLAELGEAATRFADEDVRCAVQQCLCENLEAILLQLRQKLPPDVTERIFAATVPLLQVRHPAIGDGPFGAIGGLYFCSPDPFGPERQGLLLAAVRDALGGRHRGAIEGAVGLLHIICMVDRTPFVQHFDDLLARLEALLKTDLELKGVHQALLAAVAAMFQSDPGIANGEERLLAIMRTFRAIEIDPKSEEAVAHANSIFEPLCRVYGAYAAAFYPEGASSADPAAIAKERAMLIELAALAAAILPLPRVSDFVLLAFCGMAQHFAERCSRKNNVVLNRSVVHAVINKCLERDRPERLRKRGKATADLLKSR
jgi:hypothetical protein